MERVNFFEGKSVEVLYDNKVYEVIMITPKYDITTYLGLAFDRNFDGSFDFLIQIEVADAVSINKIICNKANNKVLNGFSPVIRDDKAFYERIQHSITNIEMVLVRDKVRKSNNDFPFKYPFEYNEVIYIKAEDGVVKKIIDLSEAIRKIVQAVSGNSCVEGQVAYDATLANDEEKKLLESICPFEDIYFYNN